jgi:hypothetical protein
MCLPLVVFKNKQYLFTFSAFISDYRMEEDGFVLVRSNKGKRKLSKKPPPPWLLSLQVGIGSLTFLFRLCCKVGCVVDPYPIRSVSGSDLSLIKTNILKVLVSVAGPWHFGVDQDPDLDPRILSLTNGSGCGSGSCYFRHWLSRCQLKQILKKFFCVLPTFLRYCNIIVQR